MKLISREETKAGDIRLITDKGTFIIACSADGLVGHYGVSKEGDEMFSSIRKGAGQKLYKELIKLI